MKLDADRILSITAILIGIGSLVVVIYQTRLMRQSESAQVLPYLMTVVQSSPDGSFFVLRNAGVGPARIDDVRVRYRGQELQSDAYDFFLKQHPEALALDVDRISPGRLVPAGEWIRMVSASGGEPGREFLGQLLHMFQVAEVPQTWLAAAGVTPQEERAMLEITYSSVFGERWRVRSDRFVPETR